MRRFLIALALCLAAPLAVSAPALAEARQPVVVELFTSQGCSSCPPADRLLGQLAERDDVIPLALHVDYWDYIGWRDIFGDPAHTRRQKAYAAAAGERSIYTPQMVIGGRDHLVGFKPMKLMELVQHHHQTPDPVRVSATRADATHIDIRARLEGRHKGEMVVHLVEYSPRREVAIQRGENAGHTYAYSNVVTKWKTVGRWDGSRPLSLRVPAEGPCAIIIQAGATGPILGAARLR